MQKKIKIVLFWILFGLTLPLFSQQSDQLIILNADSLKGTANEANPFRIYEGNVAFKNDDILVYCDKARHYFAKNMAFLEGNVKLLQNDLELRSPYVIYNGNTKVAIAKRSVEIIDGETYLSADSGRYNMKSKDAFFLGNVYIEDDSVMIFSDNVHHNRNTEISHTIGNSSIVGKYSNTAIYADSISNFPQKNYTAANGNPLLIQIDTVFKDDDISFDTLTVISRKMEAFREPNNETYIFTDSVEIFKKEVLTRSMKTIYAKDKDYIRLTGEPVVWYDSTQLNADSIIIELRQNELRKIKTYFKSIAMVKNDSTYSDRINQISGDSLFIEFVDSKPFKLTSFDNAKSLYFLIDEEGGSGVERKNTKKVVVDFDDGEIKLIYWIGTTTGEYYPETLMQDPKKFNLPLFNWRTDKPDRPNLDYK